MSMLTFLEILKGAHNGPPCSAREWDFKVVPAKVTQTLGENDMAQHREIDIIHGDSKTTIFGHSIIAGTPFGTLASRRPTEEWQNIYRKVKKELIDLGVPLDSL